MVYTAVLIENAQVNFQQLQEGSVKIHPAYKLKLMARNCWSNNNPHSIILLHSIGEKQYHKYRTLTVSDILQTGQIANKTCSDEQTITML